MKFFKNLYKTVDEKFKDIGFVKVREDAYGVVYERYDEKYKYTQVVAILHKANGQHIVQSYDKDLFDSKMIGNTGVGLTYYETKLIVKKMKQMGYHK